jgi:hypothetical protein
MKTTIDLPEEMLHRAKVLAARRHSSLKELVIAGLDHVLGTSASASHEAPLGRLRQGLHLGNQVMSRDEIHARR